MNKFKIKVKNNFINSNRDKNIIFHYEYSFEGKKILERLINFNNFGIKVNKK